MQTDVSGRVRNVSLAASKPLLPLYEAIVNSIQAIEDAAEKQGRIEITVVRSGDHLYAEQDKSLGDVVGFEVQDDGIGFTNENYHAFETSDTTYKAARGGRGIGRFVWLKAFDRVHVESHYLTGKKRECRRFDFVAEGDGIQNPSCSPSEEPANRTIVALAGFKDPYRTECPKKLDTIGAYIIEHCLEYLIREDCPEIWLSDKSGGESIPLKSMFEKEMVANSKSQQFGVGTEQFDIIHVRLYSAHAREHLVHYCAHDRVVKSERLAGKVPNLARRLCDDNGKEFTYAAYVEAVLLDSRVNSERTDFSIPEDNGELIANDVTWVKIREAVAEQCGQYLAPYTEAIRRKKTERIDRFVAVEAPMYRPIMKHIARKVDMIDPEIGDDDLDLRLYEAYHELQVELKAEGKQLLDDDNEGADEFDDYRAKLEEYFSKATDANKADLARYVCHRRAILEFLHKQLSRRPDGKYPLEDRVHGIIFPMRKTSDEVLLEEHNLWLLDEKLAYHAFLASDKQLRTLAPLNNESQKEPDIIVFDKACAFVAATDPPFPAVVIIEFKRPMRDDYSDDKNPFSQVFQYITDIRGGTARTPDGRDVPVPDGVPFYCYIVCDPSATLDTQAANCNLDKTPDGQGYFGYMKKYNAYIEVLSYTKVVTDAKQRNAVLFNKLGLPSRIGGT